MTIGTGPGELCARIVVDCSADTVVPDSAHGMTLAAVGTPGTVYTFNVDERFRGDRARVDIYAVIECGTGVNSRLALLTGGGMDPVTGNIVVTITDLAGAAAASTEFLRIAVWRVGRTG